jgi:hypothetical protein
MTDDAQAHGDPQGDPLALRAALDAANRLINRLQELVADHLAKTAIDEREAFYQLVQALETAPEITAIRMALDDDPARFGEPTPAAAGDHTG